MLTLITQKLKTKKHTNKRKTTQSPVRTAHLCVCIIVHNCRTQHRTEQF